MHPESGNYSSIKHPQFHFEEGERVDFFCPICMQSLDAAMDENLVHVVMIDKLQTEHEIYFSRIAGEQRTYQISEEGIKSTGEHSYRYTHFEMSDELIHSLNI